MSNSGVVILMMILLALSLLLLFRLIKFAMNGKEGFDYYITRAEMTGDGDRIVRDSGRVRALQPVIEILMCAVLLSGFAGFLTGNAAGPFAVWLKKYGLWVSLVLLVLLAGVVITVRLNIAGQMKENPPDTILPDKEEYTVVGTRNPKRVQLLSGLPLMLALLSVIWGIGLTSKYVSRRIMLFLLLLSLGLIVFVLWAAHRERRNFIQIMVIDCRGIRIVRKEELPGRLIPWKDIGLITVSGNRLEISWLRENGADDGKIVVSLEKSLIRGETIATVAEHYRRKADENGLDTAQC